MSKLVNKPKLKKIAAKRKVIVTKKKIASDVKLKTKSQALHPDSYYRLSGKHTDLIRNKEGFHKFMKSLFTSDFTIQEIKKIAELNPVFKHRLSLYGKQAVNEKIEQLTVMRKNMLANKGASTAVARDAILIEIVQLKELIK